jgi:hypothetical protein
MTTSISESDHLKRLRDVAAESPSELSNGESYVRADDLRALIADYDEMREALRGLRDAQTHVLEVKCAGDDEYMAAVDGADAVLAKAQRVISKISMGQRANGILY